MSSHPSGEASLPLGAVEVTLRRIGERDARIGAFVEVLEDRAIAEASALVSAPRGALHGVPVAIKELFDVRSADNTYGSLVHSGRRASADATIVRRLNGAGAIVVGLTRSHEFGWGITTQHERRGSTRNPRDHARVPGGSSGGSAAAVAAGMVPLAIGTDTGGSIRIPASFCGVLGLKTTFGSVSRHGSVALAPSFDTPGLLAQTIDLLRRGFLAVAGPDPADPITLTRGEARSLRCDGTFTYAVPGDMQPRPLDKARRSALEHAAAALAEIDGLQVETSPVDLAAVSDVFVPQIMAEAHFVHSQILGTWPRDAALYGRDLVARLRAAESVTLADYLEARTENEAIRAGFGHAFDVADVLVNVVGVSGPSTIDDPDHVVVDGRRLSLLEALMPSTLPQNLAGLPSLTVPIGTGEDGLSIGVQLTGRPWSELLLLEVGRRLEAAGAIAAPA